MSIVMDLFKKSSKKESVQHFISVSNQVDLNDPLVKKIQQKLNIEQQEIFIQSFYSYLSVDKEKDFSVDLDSIFQWLGYAQKVKAKELLEKHFEKDVDYKVLLSRSGKQRGGHNKQQILMNVKTFKKLCMKADTKKADQIHDYYIMMEDVMMEHTKEQLQLQSQKLKENQQLLDQQYQELIKYKELVYEEVDKTENIYVFTTDKIGVYKVGKTVNKVSARKSNSNTLLTDDIQIVHQVKTNCCKFVEEVVHFVLDRYRSNSNRELFRCDLEYIKTVIRIVAGTIDTLKSSFHTIPLGELYTKVQANIEVAKHIIDDESDEEIAPENSLYKFLLENTRYKQDNVMLMDDIRKKFNNWLQKNTRSLDNGTFGQVNKKYIIEQIITCKHCTMEHKRGCCEMYNRTQRSTKRVVRNLEMIDFVI
jgi:MSV199 domain/Meiotically up-regulated gene 113